jgi:hypothetical protein
MLAIVIALAGMWLLALGGRIALYYFVIRHLGDYQWWFMCLGNPYAPVQQIVVCYIGFIIAQIPAAAFAGLIIGSSSFSHPLRATFWILVTYQLFLTAIDLPDLGWLDIQGSQQLTLMVAYFISLLTLIGVSMFVASLTPPNKSPEPTAVGACSSAVAVHVASRRWLSFFR